MRRVTFTELQKNLASHLDEVEIGRDELVVKRRNRAPVVILPLREWEGMKETVYLLSSPVNAEILLASIAEMDAGKSLERELIDPEGEACPRTSTW